VETDAAFRLAILSPDEPSWGEIDAEKNAFGAIIERIVRRNVDAGLLRADFSAGGFILITRGAMANMSGGDDWGQHVTLQLEGIRGSL
jgi:hypothetical protein